MYGVMPFEVGRTGITREGGEGVNNLPLIVFLPSIFFLAVELKRGK